MKTSINLHDFRDAFRAHGRTENFSYLGLELLFNYLEELEEETGEEIELDVVGLCCDYCEDTADSIANDYSIDMPDATTDEERADIVRDYLIENTTIVGEMVDSFVFAVF